MHLHYLTKEELRTIELARRRTDDGLDDVLAIIDRLDKVVLEHEHQKHDREFVGKSFKKPRGACVEPSPIEPRDDAQKELDALKSSLAQCQFGCFDRTDRGWLVDGFVHEGLGGYIPNLERPEGGSDE